jgi:hypothetical protein
VIKDMAVFIADTNLWIAASGRSDMSPECARATLQFVVALQGNDDRLAVDYQWKLLGEYYREISEQDVAHEILDLLFSQNRLDWCQIELDSDGNAVVPVECAVHDFSDRKFVAVALAHEARPPIHNVSDEDWLEDEEMLARCGVQVIHHCEAELRGRYADKRRATV